MCLSMFFSGAIMCIRMVSQLIDFISQNMALISLLPAGGWAVYKFIQSGRRANSKFYLEKYIDASGYILKFLESDNPTRRIAWISAGRIAEKLYVLKDKITEEPDKEFLKIYLRSFTHQLNFYFLKPWSYFCLVENSVDPEDALEKSWREQLIVHSTPKRWEKKFIDELTIKSIFSLTIGTWEDEAGRIYKDEEFLEIMKGVYPGLGCHIEECRNLLKKYSMK